MTATRLFDRAVIRLTPTEEGEHVAGFLQGLVTNDVTGRLPVYAGLLTPQGKALFDVIIWPGGHGEMLIDCEAVLVDELIKRLSLYRLRRKIAIAAAPEIGVHWQREPGDGGAADPRLYDLGQRWLAPVADTDLAADTDWLKHRLALGVAEGRAEMGDVLWLETNAGELHGVSFTKGCYVGQENTARMNWRQKVNRRLLVVPLARSDPKRQKCVWPDLGLALDHLRAEDIDLASAPAWMRDALSTSD